MDVAAIDLQTIPLSALRLNLRKKLSIYLDPIKILPTSDGRCRDWKGIFHSSGMSNDVFQFVSSNVNPTIEMIVCLVEQRTTTTFADFIQWLEDIDRHDVVDDTYELFVQDAEEYLLGHQKQFVETSNRGTRNNLPLQQYDAFILYDDMDEEFAYKMLGNLEGSGFKLCIKNRDFLGGSGFEHDTMRNLLMDRCDRLIVILSENFVCSPLNEYISNLAQSLGIENQMRKIIPCVYAPQNRNTFELPRVFKGIHPLHYGPLKKYDNFWEKLENSLKPSPEEQIGNLCPQIVDTGADDSCDLQKSINLLLRQSTQADATQQGMEFESLINCTTSTPDRSSFDSAEMSAKMSSNIMDQCLNIIMSRLPNRFRRRSHRNRITAHSQAVF